MGESSDNIDQWLEQKGESGHRSVRHTHHIWVEELGCTLAIADMTTAELEHVYLALHRKGYGHIAVAGTIERELLLRSTLGKNNPTPKKPRRHELFHSDTPPTNKGKPKMKNDLYKVLDPKKHGIEAEEMYGVYMATNSAGQMVLELRDGSNTYFAFDSAAIEEVMPYTVALQFETGGQHYHYFAVAGVFAVNDMIFVQGKSNSLGRITKINTKSRNANKDLTGFKLTGTMITSTTDAD